MGHVRMLSCRMCTRLIATHRLWVPAVSALPHTHGAQQASVRIRLKSAAIIATQADPVTSTNAVEQLPDHLIAANVTGQV